MPRRPLAHPQVLTNSPPFNEQLALLNYWRNFNVSRTCLGEVARTQPCSACRPVAPLPAQRERRLLPSFRPAHAVQFSRITAAASALTAAAVLCFAGRRAAGDIPRL